MGTSGLETPFSLTDRISSKFDSGSDLALTSMTLPLSDLPQLFCVLLSADVNRQTGRGRKSDHPPGLGTQNTEH